MNEAEESEANLFNAARLLTDPAQRAAFLDAACRGDAELRRRLDQLLASQPEAEAFFEKPMLGPRVLPTAPASTFADGPGSPDASPFIASSTAQESRGPPDEDAGTVIGRYKLLQKIGEGGFGAVYMAEQKEPVKRRVALKIIKLGMDTRQVVVRFEAERQALALMDHPNIAKVFDAGATGSGRPYFVMELVRGVPITRYCDENNLPPAGRLTLFMQVCRAIQHAHQKGVIHRDIKPSNILVTLHDGVPVPKVIDFGIAKATQMELTEKTLFTQFHQFIGTPAYMSPEQAERSGLDIDTRSDIYSLGVLLYELLTGKTPFDGKELLAAGLDEMRRTIREREPVRPSTRLNTMADAERTSVAKHRQSGALKLIHLLSGDLDWIVMKALEKDRNRRYETANSFALDLERHLNNEPVVARPPSQLYRLQKFAQRNKLTFAAVSTIVMVLMLGVFGSTWEAIRATRAERTARRTAYIAEMKLAQQAVTDGHLGRARQLLAHHLPVAGQSDLRGFEWRYLARLTRGEDSQRLIAHTNGITGLCFLDDNHLLSVSVDHRMVWWDLTQGRASHTLTNANSIISLALARGGDFAALACESDRLGFCVTLLDLKLRLERANSIHFPGLDSAVIDFSPSGELAIGDVFEPGDLSLWDADAGKKLANLTVDKNKFNAVRFSPDGRRLAVADRQGFIQIWDVESRSNLFSWHAHAPEAKFPFTINTLAFSPDGRHLLSAGRDGKVCVWEPGTGNRPVQLEGHHAAVMDASFSSDGRWLATASLDHTLSVSDTASWTVVKTFRGHSDEVHHVAWSPNGRRLASGSGDGELLVWDWPPPTNSAERIEFAATLNFSFSAAGDTFLRLTTNNPPVVEVWDTKTLQLTAQYPIPNTNIVSGWIVPGGRLVVSGDSAGRVGIRDLATGREITGTNAYRSEVYQITGSTDGRVLITATRGMDNEQRIWEFPSLISRHSFHGDASFDTWAISPDAACLAIGYTINQIDLRDLPSGKRRILWPAHRLNLKALAFSPDGKLLASSSWDRTGKLWDVHHGQLLRSIEGNLLTIESLAFSPDGKRLAAGTGEGMVKLYDVPAAQEVATFKGHRGPVYAVTFIPDGTKLISLSFDALCVWHAPDLRDLKEVEASLSAKLTRTKDTR